MMLTSFLYSIVVLVYISQCVGFKNVKRFTIQPDHFITSKLQFFSSKTSDDKIITKDLTLNQVMTNLLNKQLSWEIVPDMWETLCDLIPEQPMIVDLIHDEPVTMTFKDARNKIEQGTSAMQQLGIRPGDCVSLFAENSNRWFVMDQSIMKAGGCDAVRGINAPIDELKYIYNHSRSVGMIVENIELLKSLFTNYSHSSKQELVRTLSFPLPKFIIVLYPQKLYGSEIKKLLIESTMQSINSNHISNANSNISQMNRVTESYKNSPSMSWVKSYQLSNTTTNTNNDLIIPVEKSIDASTATVPVNILDNVTVLTYEEVLSLGSYSTLKSVPWARDGGSTATLVYTSGTTAKPKGVILSHKNLLHQIRRNTLSAKSSLHPINPRIGDVFLSILPCWHIFDRTCELYCLGRGASIVYSNLRSFKSDLVTRRPHVMIVVPRLLEMIQKGIISNLKQQIGIKKKLIELATKITNTFHYCSRIARNSNISNKRPNILKRFLFGFFALIIWPLYQVMDELVWSKVRAGLGGRLKGLISGGASLPMSTDRFFEMIGIHVINGYGMTETSAPIINRKVEHSVTGTVGSVMEDSQLKIVDPETRSSLPAGQVGLLLVRGPGVFSGYMADDQATRAAFDTEGYLNTGDLAMVDPATESVIITGRYKDTIVLSNGENVAPEPIEQLITASAPLIISQVMLLGQDQRALGALIVVNTEEAARYLESLSPSATSTVNSSINNINKSQVDDTIVSNQQTSCSVVSTTTSTSSAMPASVIPNDSKTTLNTSSTYTNPKDSEGIEDDHRLRAYIRNAIDTATTDLPYWQRVGSFKLVTEPFTVSNGLLTQTLKIKRREVELRFAQEISSIYSKKSDSV